MTVEKLAKKLDLEVIAGETLLDKKVSGCYIGDLLSRVMGKAKNGDVWITIMGNINTIAVAVLAETACVVLAENAELDKNALQKAAENNVIVLRSVKSAFNLACETGDFLNS